jgi:ribosome-associated protein
VDGDELRSANGLTVGADGLSWSFTRSTGAGGQHVNKASTRATLDVDLGWLEGPSATVERVRRVLGGALRVSSQGTRSQWRNRQECLSRAAQLLDEAATATVQRRPSKPTRGSVERRLAAKRRDSDKKLGRRSTEW